MIELLLAAGKIDVNLEELLLGSGKVDVDSKAKNGKTALSFTAISGCTMIVKQELDSGKCDANSKDNGGRSALSLASMCGRRGGVTQFVRDSRVDGNISVPLAAHEGNCAVTKPSLPP